MSGFSQVRCIRWMQKRLNFKSLIWFSFFPAPPTETKISILRLVGHSGRTFCVVQKPRTAQKTVKPKNKLDEGHLDMRLRLDARGRGHGNRPPLFQNSQYMQLASILEMFTRGGGRRGNKLRGTRGGWDRGFNIQLFLTRLGGVCRLFTGKGLIFFLVLVLVLLLLSLSVSKIP